MYVLDWALPDPVAAGSTDTVGLARLAMALSRYLPTQYSPPHSPCLTRRPVLPLWRATIHIHMRRLERSTSFGLWCQCEWTAGAFSGRTRQAGHSRMTAECARTRCC